MKSLPRRSHHTYCAVMMLTFALLLPPNLSIAADLCTTGTRIHAKMESSPAPADTNSCLAGLGANFAGVPSFFGGITTTEADGIENLTVTGKRINAIQAQMYHFDLNDLLRGSFTYSPQITPSDPKEEADQNANSKDCTGLNPKDGNPVSSLSGAKSLWATDYSSADRLPLKVTREYSVSLKDSVQMFGRGWSAPSVGRLTVVPAESEQGNWATISVSDSISSYLFDYNLDTKEIALKAGYATRATLSRQILDGANLWVLHHPDGSYSVFSDDDGYLQGFLLTTFLNDGQFLRYYYAGLYNLNKNPVRIVHSAGAYVDFTYEIQAGAYVVSTVKNALEDTWRYQYDASGRLISAYDPLGYRYQYEYDSIHRLTGVISKAGDKIGSWTYNSSDRVTSSSRFDGSQLVTFQYASSQPGIYQTITVTDEFGRVKMYVSGIHNGRTYLISTDEKADSSCPKAVTSADYYAATGLPLEVTTASGLKTTYTYDNYFRPDSVSISDVSGSEYPVPDRKITKGYELELPFIRLMTFWEDDEAIYKVDYDHCLESNTSCRPGLLLREAKTDLRNAGGVREVNFSYSFGANY